MSRPRDLAPLPNAARHAATFVESANLSARLGFGKEGLLVVHGGVTVIKARSAWK